MASRDDSLSDEQKLSLVQESTARAIQWLETARTNQESDQKALIRLSSSEQPATTISTTPVVASCHLSDSLAAHVVILKKIDCQFRTRLFFGTRYCVLLPDEYQRSLLAHFGTGNERRLEVSKAGHSIKFECFVLSVFRFTILNIQPASCVLQNMIGMFNSRHRSVRSCLRVVR